MKVRDFLAGLDEARVALRSQYDVKKDELNSEAPVVRQLQVLIDSVNLQRVPATADAPPPPPEEPEDLWSQPQGPAVVDIVERSESDGGGTMTVFAREKPFVPRKPDLVEVTEEEVSK